ncbi:vitamin K epoxide reductase/DsbA family protein [Sorangium atrum]|uniref:Vitamin K epoxide reductase family protein n=1 Tax=Sorangium atrum TaxID=2995308 RepID=A0ABT5BW22_9BACT|nr:vitamin K epoxide reductase family protein [Sorangium aterium]MDC0678341.1 vitamin K epoxide reductase family protein [Sorangium aterium]
MSGSRGPRGPAALALSGSLLGLAFSASSTFDYIRHLDRQVHDLHCSFIPGLGAQAGADTACRVAMYSPYSALFREGFWGGIPISLFALGAFAFFAAFALYVLLSAEHAPRRAAHFLFVAGLTPLAVSLMMAIISATRLGVFCKTCVGMYISSVLLAAGGVWAFLEDRRAARAAAWSSAAPRAAAPAGAAGVGPTVPAAPLGVDAPGGAAAAPAQPARRMGSLLLLPGWLVALAVCTVTPALLYASALPSYASYMTGCGKLEKPTEPNGALLHVTRPGAVQPATIFVDPLCPTCKAFHQRLVSEGVFDKLDATLVLFPLDSECNWMLDRPVHPGSCLLSKAILCSDHRAMDVLEWAYENQEELLAGAKAGAGTANVQAAIRQRWPGLDACMDSKETALRLNRMLRYIVDNKLPVSTPQMFLGTTRLCDEDTDIGMSYAIRQLAPALRTK